MVTFKLNKIIFISLLIAACVGNFCVEDAMSDQDNNSKELPVATFAGGCFWCMEKPYEQYDGITQVISGYTGGQRKNPTYSEVSSGSTAHIEAVQITYDPDQISYNELLDIFWRQIDPTDDGGQFADRGSQYKTAIFYHDDQQKNFAEASKQALEDSKKFNKPIATKIIQALEFYPAEEYHQDYYKKNPVPYKNYYHFSGREQYLKKVWGKK